MSSDGIPTSELISKEWNFDPAIDVKSYRAKWQRAEKMAKSELLSLEGFNGTTDVTLLKRLDQLFAFVDFQMSEAGLWQNYHPQDEMRKQAEVVEAAASALWREIGASPSLARLIEETPSKHLDAVGSRYHKLAKRDARRAGAYLDDEARTQFRTNAAELQDLVQAFQRRINEDDSHLMVEPEQLELMPLDYRNSHPVDPATGTVKISVQTSDYSTFMLYSEDDTVKEKLWQLSMNRAPDNEEGLKRMIELRYQQARLLGYDSFAQFSMETCMLSDPVTTRSLLVDINKKAKATSEPEKRALADIMSEKGKELKPWNMAYAKAQLLRNKFPGFEPLNARQFFPFKNVVSGVMQLLESLFSVEFHEVQGVSVWHPSVRVYDLFDKSQGETSDFKSSGTDENIRQAGTMGATATRALGRIYVDLMTRENKNSHPYTFPIRHSAAGSPITPSVALGDCFGVDEDVCVDLEHCSALLHELGHCIHFVLAQNSEYYQFNGLSVEQDFCEAPSDLLEEMMWRSEIVERVAINKGGQSMPQEYLEALIAGSRLGKTMEIRSQTNYALLSVRTASSGNVISNRSHLALQLDIHANLDEHGKFKGNTLDITKSSFEAYGNVGYIPGLNFQHCFSHLAGYDCRYFSYITSMVIVKDLAQKLLGQGFSPAVGLQYRRAILEPGSAKDGTHLIRDFLGRDYSYEAFYRWMET